MNHHQRQQTRPQRLHTRDGTWFLDVECLKPLNRVVFRPHLQTIEGRQQILEQLVHLPSGRRLRESANRLMDAIGAGEGVASGFVPSGADWAPFLGPMDDELPALPPAGDDADQGEEFQAEPINFLSQDGDNMTQALMKTVDKLQETVERLTTRMGQLEMSPPPYAAKIRAMEEEQHRLRTRIQHLEKLKATGSRDQTDRGAPAAGETDGTIETGPAAVVAPAAPPVAGDAQPSDEAAPAETAAAQVEIADVQAAPEAAPPTETGAAQAEAAPPVEAAPEALPVDSASAEPVPDDAAPPEPSPQPADAPEPAQASDASAPHLKLPSAEVLSVALQTLVGAEFSLTEVTEPLTSESGDALYVCDLADDEGHTVGAFLATRPCVTYVGGTLLMLPTEQLNTLINADEESPDAVDAMSEVFNTMSGKLNELPQNPHIRTKALRSFDAAQDAWVLEASARLDLQVTGGGKLAVLAKAL